MKRGKVLDASLYQSWNVCSICPLHAQESGRRQTRSAFLLSLLQWQGLKGRSKRELKAWLGLCLNDWRTIHQKKSWSRMWQQSQSGVHIATPPLVLGSCWMRAHSSSLSSSLLTHLRTWEGVGSASARCCLFHCVLLTHMPRLPQDTAVSSLSRFLRMGFRFIGAYEPKQRTWATESARMSSSAKGG